MKSAPAATATPPRWPVIAQALAVPAAAVLAWLVVAREAPWLLALVGYALGAVVTVFLLTLYRSINSLRRSKTFRRSPMLDRLAQGLAVAGLLVGLGCGYLVATELAKW